MLNQVFRRPRRAKRQPSLNNKELDSNIDQFAAKFSHNQNWKLSSLLDEALITPCFLSRAIQELFKNCQVGEIDNANYY